MVKQIVKKVKQIVKENFDFLWDTIDLLLGRRDELTPPYKVRVQVGSFSDARYYRAVGEEFFQYFKALCGLKPDEDIFDVGCGCGQMAASLTKYLDQSGTYEGFDIVSTMIEWCRKISLPNTQIFTFG